MCTVAVTDSDGTLRNYYSATLVLWPGSSGRGPLGNSHKALAPGRVRPRPPWGGMHRTGAYPHSPPLSRTPTLQPVSWLFSRILTRACQGPLLDIEGLGGIRTRDGQRPLPFLRRLH